MRTMTDAAERLAIVTLNLDLLCKRAALAGDPQAARFARMAVEAVDLQLGRLIPAVLAMKGAVLVTADHGNADEMFELDKKTKQPALNKDGSFKAKTAHTLNPVPLILFDKVTGGRLGLKQTDTAGLSSIAATVANLLGLEKHAKWDEGVLEVI